MINLNDVHVVKPEETPSYKEVIEVANYVAENSFSETTGLYCKYLKDYVMNSAILQMFTDYEGEMTFEDILEMMGNEDFNDLIKSITEIHSHKYFSLVRYATSAIEEKSKPLSNMTRTMNALTKVLNTANDLIEKLDPEILKDIDLKSLIEAIGGQG